MSDDVVARFQESITEAFGWKSAIKFDFVDIGAELDRHKIRHLFPVEASALPGVVLLFVHVHCCAYQAWPPTMAVRKLATALKKAKKQGQANTFIQVDLKECA